jgi:translation initiation factor RLI1
MSLHMYLTFSPQHRDQQSHCQHQCHRRKNQKQQDKNQCETKQPQDKENQKMSDESLCMGCLIFVIRFVASGHAGLLGEVGQRKGADVNL